MSMRYTIQTAVTFEPEEPKFLLVEWFGRDNGGAAGRCVGQFHTVEEALSVARQRHTARAKPVATIAASEH